MEDKRTAEAKAHSIAMNAVFGDEDRGLGGRSGGSGTAGDEAGNVCWGHIIAI